ncbi:MAG: DNA-formamidopyrimidine glycosylase family protein, partial [bacterium]
MPDIEAYVEALAHRVVGQRLLGIRLASPFLLRTVDPPLAAAAGGRVEGVQRLGKRVVLEVAGGRAQARKAAPLFLVIHLMVAGRLHWKKAGSSVPRGSGMAAFDFATGTLLLTEAGTKRRASLHLVRGREALAALDPGGIDLFTSDPALFGSALQAKNHTLKRALTDPSVVSGIGERLFRRDPSQSAGVSLQADPGAGSGG